MRKFILIVVLTLITISFEARAVQKLNCGEILVEKGSKSEEYQNCIKTVMDIASEVVDGK